MAEQLDIAKRAAVAADFERARSHGLTIADAAKRFAAATEALEWALWATDPDEDRGSFNQTYADEQLVECVPEWYAARDDLRTVLELHARRLDG